MDIFLMGSRHGLNDFEQIAMLFVLFAAFISLIYAWWLRGVVLKKDKGTEKMQEIWNAIRIGANAYLNRQLKTILPIVGVLMLVMFFSVYVSPPKPGSTGGVRRFRPTGDHDDHCLRSYDRISPGGCIFANSRSIWHEDGRTG